VLVVDDEASVRTLIERVLELEGYGVLGADSGAEALALLKDHPVDAMLVDKHLPEMNGYEVIQAARDVQHDVAVVLMTAYPEADGMAALKLDGYLPKPFRRPSDVTDTLASALDQRERRQLQHQLLETLLQQRHA